MVFGGFLLGAAWGSFLAYRRKGSRWDMAQYAGGFGIFFAIIALFLNIFLLRGM